MWNGSQSQVVEVLWEGVRDKQKTLRKSHCVGANSVNQSVQNTFPLLVFIIFLNYVFTWGLGV